MKDEQIERPVVEEAIRIAYREGYQKAIDDFKKAILHNCKEVYEIAEQLKEGAKNDD